MYDFIPTSFVYMFQSSLRYLPMRPDNRKKTVKTQKRIITMKKIINQGEPVPTKKIISNCIFYLKSIYSKKKGKPAGLFYLKKPAERIKNAPVLIQNRTGAVVGAFFQLLYKKIKNEVKEIVTSET
ncbi:MAG: hypothetical protein R2861_01560 [Desulfobacterales bacterium]